MWHLCIRNLFAYPLNEILDWGEGFKLSSLYNYLFLVSVLGFAIASSLFVIAALTPKVALGDLLNITDDNQYAKNHPFYSDIQNLCCNLLLRFVKNLGLQLSIERDLLLVESSWSKLASLTTLGFCVGLVSSLVGCYLLMVFVNLSNIEIEVLIVATCVAFGSTLPLLIVKANAKKLRANYLISLSVLLDIVSMFLAGGMGIEQSLIEALKQLNTEFSKRLSRELDFVLATGREIFEVFISSGHNWGISELVEVGNSLRMAGHEGSRIRQSLVTKSETLRQRILYEEKESANKTTEKLFFPGVVLLIGFLIFVGYPAVVQILNGL
jgi:tight adherence protein C